MSEALISKFVPMVGPLLGAIVGGLIASLTAYGVECKKWRREHQEKLASLKREALAAALEWIEPMRNAEARASALVMSAIRGELDHEDFLKEFPNLRGELAIKDLKANQRIVLPGNIYSQGHSIILELDELRYLGVKYGQAASIMGKSMAGYQECRVKLDAIGKQILGLEEDLRKMFSRTFDQK